MRKYLFRLHSVSLFVAMLLIAAESKSCAY
jgi:hypothetical protein